MDMDIATAKCGKQVEGKEDKRVFSMTTDFLESWYKGTSSEVVPTQLTHCFRVYLG